MSKTSPNKVSFKMIIKNNKEKISIGHDIKVKSFQHFKSIEPINITKIFNKFLEENEYDKYFTLTIIAGDFKTEK